MKEANRELPVIPLKNIVVFPAMIVPIYVGRARSLAALEAATAGDKKQIFLAAQKDNAVKEPASFEELYAVGTIAKILQLLRLPDGTVKVLVEGVARAAIAEERGIEPYFKAGLTLLTDILKPSEQLEKVLKQTVEKFDDFVKVNKKIPAETLMSIVNTDDPARLSDLVVSYLSLSLAEKQQQLETLDVLERLTLINRYLLREVGLLDVEKKLHNKVQDQIEKVQKEYYLKEKLKEIQKELGENFESYSETEEYKVKIERSAMPPDTRKKAFRELSRLEKLQSVSAEANVIRTYLDWLLDIPWQAQGAAPAVDLSRVRNVLDEDHYGLEKIKERIVEYLAVFYNTGKPAGSIILFAGPPGVGKTSIVQSIARSMGREFYRISLGGLHDEAELRGHRRTYVGAMPGKIIQALAKTKSKTPVILLDEIDKLGKDHRGDPAAVLMEILDPAQNKYFMDNYLEVPIDLSGVLFIATANNYFDIPGPLLDRLELLKLSGYTEEEKLQIARRHLLPQVLKESGLAETELDFTEEGLRMIIGEYTREAGLRDFRRKLADICRRAVKNKLENKKIYKKISRHNMHYYLGVPPYTAEIHEINDEVGVVKGLAWTEAGGDILPIETTVMPGKGELILTGKLGEVMQESAKAALTFVRSRCAELLLEKDFYKKSDIHIHLPEGAIPKDGPSAGVAIAVSIASALAGLPVRGDVAMTGEITLRGRILKIGGLKEKILAAARNEIKAVLFPAENKPEIKEFSGKIKKKVQLVPVKTMDDVFFYVIKGYKKDELTTKISPEILAEDIDGIADDNFIS